MNTKNILSLAGILLVGLVASVSAPLTTQAVVADNPVPSISSISPTTATTGGASFVVTVNGSNFLPTSTVNFNGSARATNYISSSQLTATVNAADITSSGSYNITVSNPSPGGGTSNTSTLTVAVPSNNPIPVVTSISPNTRALNGGAFTITVTGNNFIPTSRVSYNGLPRTTTFVSGTQLTAAIPASDVNTAGIFLVSVTNPTPGGGTSNYLPFTVSGTGTTPTTPTTPNLPDTGFGPSTESQNRNSGIVAGLIALILGMSLVAGLNAKRLLAAKK